MNINASNQSLFNLLNRQNDPVKRPTFSSVFEKLNKRTSKLNNKNPLNSAFTNEQMFRYYTTEVEPLLNDGGSGSVDDNFGLDDDFGGKSLQDMKVGEFLKILTNKLEGKTGEGKIKETENQVYTSLFPLPSVAAAAPSAAAAAAPPSSAGAGTGSSGAVVASSLAPSGTGSSVVPTPSGGGAAAAAGTGSSVAVVAGTGSSVAPTSASGGAAVSSVVAGTGSSGTGSSSPVVAPTTPSGGAGGLAMFSGITPSPMLSPSTAPEIATTNSSLAASGLVANVSRTLTLPNVEEAGTLITEAEMVKATTPTAASAEDAEDAEAAEAAARPAPNDKEFEELLKSITDDTAQFELNYLELSTKRPTGKVRKNQKDWKIFKERTIGIREQRKARGLPQRTYGQEVENYLNE